MTAAGNRLSTISTSRVLGTPACGDSLPTAPVDATSPGIKSTKRACNGRLPPEREKGFQQAIIDLARALQWHVYHPFDSRRSEAGFPDLTLVRPPYVIFAEIKTERGRMSIDQVKWMQLLNRCPGVEYYQWRPSQWLAIVNRLQGGASWAG